MPKLALHFICKNERAQVRDMLLSVLSITDLIVANDTGSTDGTQEIIRQFGVEHGIPTVVVERAFDDFGASRNFALSSLQDEVRRLGWDEGDTWAFWLNCRERMVVGSGFSKEQFVYDLLYVPVLGSERKSRRKAFLKLDAGFYWYGPVYEIVKHKKQDITKGNITGLSIQKGVKEDLPPEKIIAQYQKKAELLDAFLRSGEPVRSHWLYQTGHVFQRIATVYMDPDKRKKYADKASYYFNKILRSSSNREYCFLAQLQLATILENQEANPEEIQAAYLAAFEIQPSRGESIGQLILYYMRKGWWDYAYQYSKQAIDLFYQHRPPSTSSILVDESFYDWKVQELHYTICSNLGHIEEATAAMVELKKATMEHPDLFPEQKLEELHYYRV